MNNSRYFYNNEEVTLMYTHGNDSWIRLKDGSDLVVPFNKLDIKGKFEHLRNLPIDTKVLVSNGIIEQAKKRHFSHVSDNGNYVFCFGNGYTSFTSEYNDDVTGWELCEVYQE